MTDTTTGGDPAIGDPRHGAAASTCGAPLTGAPVGGRDHGGQERATTVTAPAADGYAPVRHASDDHGLPRPRFAADDHRLPRPPFAADDYGLQPYRLAPPATGPAGYGPDDDPTVPPDLASLLRRHVPTRPTWTCIADGRPWPCAAARVHLRSQYAGDAVGLSMYMSQQLMTAAVDLSDGGAPPPDLFRRFVAWT